MDYLITDQEWFVLHHHLGATSTNSRARAAAQACLFRYSVQLAKCYRSFGWASIPSELGVTGNTANKRFVEWNESAQWLQFWDALIELRCGKAKPGKPDKNLNQMNPHQALLRELERAYAFFNKLFSAGELPQSIVINIEAGQTKYRGYLHPYYWNVINKSAQHHLAVSAHLIKDGNVETVLSTLLHEMAHLRNAAINISDTHPSSQYHTQDFRDSAHLFGLKCGLRDINRGFALTSLTERGKSAITKLMPVVEIYQRKQTELTNDTEYSCKTPRLRRIE